MILAIDPGPVQSAWAFYNPALPIKWAKQDNEHVLDVVSRGANLLAVEWVASYGMPVGAEVFETCVWIGRFVERWHSTRTTEVARIYRRDVKLHLCGDTRAKDGNIRQAIIDRYGGKDKAIGKKATPGPLYGMRADCWQALAVAITASEGGTHAE